MKKKFFLPGVLVAFLFLGCSVYHPGSVSIDDGVNSENRIKVETTENLVFELKDLIREEGQLYGITGRNSDTAKLLVNREQLWDGPNVKIPFEDEEIKAIHLKNRKMSNIVNIGVPIIGAAGLLGLTSSDFKPDVGN